MTRTDDDFAGTGDDVNLFLYIIIQSERDRGRERNKDTAEASEAMCCSDNRV